MELSLKKQQNASTSQLNAIQSNKMIFRQKSNQLNDSNSHSTLSSSFLNLNIQENELLSQQQEQQNLLLQEQNFNYNFRHSTPINNPELKRSQSNYAENCCFEQQQQQSPILCNLCEDVFNANSNFNRLV